MLDLFTEIYEGLKLVIVVSNYDRIMLWRCVLQNSEIQFEEKTPGIQPLNKGQDSKILHEVKVNNMCSRYLKGAAA